MEGYYTFMVNNNMLLSPDTMYDKINSDGVKTGPNGITVNKIRQFFETKD